MKVIQKQAGPAREILGKQPLAEEKKVRFLTYVAAAPCEDGLLLHNVLTKEMILLEDASEEGVEGSIAESALLNADDLNDSLILHEPAVSDDIYRYLVENWYLVPEDNNDKELCLNLRAIAQHLKKLNSPKGFLHYTILTTTDCNARCFYCYEAGTRRENMTPETAHKVADFIDKNYEQVKETSKKSSKPQKVTISWFGGEPLFNIEVIDIITCELSERGIPFTSSMISNGYLFDDDIVKRAVDEWKLDHVQITLDGTEEIYNRAKAYIYKEGSPFIRVLDNIERLLAAGIGVTVRLNLSDENYKDLSDLIDSLIERFGHYKRFHIYVAYIYKTQEGNLNEPFRGDMSLLCDQLLKLQAKLRGAGMSSKNRLRKTVKTNNCMADNDNTVLIQADGSLGQCEHYYDSMSCGNIENGITDQGILNYWKEIDEDYAICDNCVCYPDCFRLKGCQSSQATACREVSAMREDILPSLRRDILGSYKNIKEKTSNNGERSLTHEKAISGTNDRDHTLP